MKLGFRGVGSRRFVKIGGRRNIELDVHVYTITVDVTALQKQSQALLSEWGSGQNLVPESVFL